MDRSSQQDGVFPVFVFPQTLCFDAHDRNNLKKILTLYNPYQFPIRFRVLSNASSHYSVMPDQGSLNPRNSVDLIVRVLNEVTSGTGPPLKHKLRVQVFHVNTKVGQKDVDAVIYFGNMPEQQEQEGASGSGSTPEGSQQVRSRNTPRNDSSSTSRSNNRDPAMTVFSETHSKPNYVVLIIAVCCIIGLVLPSADENCKQNSESDSNKSQSQLESIIPSYFHLSMNMKLLLAYTLGMVTMAILRP